ncbi:MAG: methyl-accepting chemotaxis protein [Ignavibacteriales bacterium]
MNVLTLSQVEGLKAAAPFLVEMFEDGACMVVTDLEKVIFKQPSKKFNVPGTDVGVPNQKGGVAERLVAAAKFVTLDVDGARYGIDEAGLKVKVIGCPFTGEDGQFVGTWLMAYPVRHPVVKAFETFSEVTDNLFEGRIGFYLTDHKKVRATSPYIVKDYAYIQAIQVGADLTPEGVALQAITQNKPITKKIPRQIFGIPVELSAYPLTLEDGSPMGTLAVVIDRNLNEDIKDQVNNLSESIHQIAAAVEEVAASTTEVAVQQGKVATHVNEIADASREIEKISTFIKSVAEETKMLGLNAAIEAARAGDVGRGFGVVAEEIRRLSEQSKQTVAEIMKFTNKILEQISVSSGAAQMTVETVEQQAAATQEINASIEEISSLAEMLAGEVQKL